MERVIPTMISIPSLVLSFVLLSATTTTEHVLVNGGSGIATAIPISKHSSNTITTIIQGNESSYNNGNTNTTATNSSTLWSNVCTQETVRDLPFCNTALSYEVRTNDYSSRIPLHNKIQMMGNTAASYEPLYIPSYQWWSEGLHGLEQPCVTTTVGSSDGKENNTTNSITKCPTSFPCPSGLGTTFNNTLYYKIGTIIGREARAMSNVRVQQQHNNNPMNRIGDGYTYWSPVINMQRDPRWGRNQEVPSEDPYVTSQYAIHYIRGLQQQEHPNNGDRRNQQHLNAENEANEPEEDSISSSTTSSLQIAACCKHYIGNSLEHWYNYSRHTFDAIITQQDLEDYYLIPFEACVKDANVLGIMCSYNSINGIPSCANEPLLLDTVRTKWNFTGYITSDCGAIVDIYKNHQYVTDPIHAVSISINATTDMNCGAMYQTHLYDAYQQDLVQEHTINESFQRLVMVQMKLGLFDNNHPDKYKDEYAILGIDDIDTNEHQQLAYEAALQSIVLLKNENNTILPIQLNHSTSGGGSGLRIAVLGPHYQAQEVFLSNYHGDRCSDNGTTTNASITTNERINVGDSTNDDYVSSPSSTYSCIETPLDAIKKANVGGITFGTMGCTVDGYADKDTDEWNKAIEMANTSDVIILMMGLDQSQEREEHDRINITLPGLQNQFITEILALQKVKTIVVMIHGGSVSLGSNHTQTIPAILDIYYGGQYASKALTSILFGTYNPTGKLSTTIYPPDYINEIPLTEMNIRTGVGRTYMYYTGVPEFTFGYGLSYSQWQLEWLQNKQQGEEEEEEEDQQQLMEDVVVTTTHSSLNDNDIHDWIPKTSINVKVCNKGPMAGSQTVLLFRMKLSSSTASFTSSLLSEEHETNPQHDNEPEQPRQPYKELVGYNATQTILEPDSCEILTFSNVPLLSKKQHQQLLLVSSASLSSPPATIVTFQAVAANNVTIEQSFRMIVPSSRVQS